MADLCNKATSISHTGCAVPVTLAGPERVTHALQGLIEAIEFTPLGVRALKALHDARQALAQPPVDTQIPRYRLLTPGQDKIEPDDEFLSEDTQTWAKDPKAIFAGSVYWGGVLRPARRLVSMEE